MWPTTSGPSGPRRRRRSSGTPSTQGINYIDTANCYAHGTSEEYIGRVLRKVGIPRDEVVLQSKVFFNEGALSKEAIEREIDGTLGRLGTDYLDVYMIHPFRLQHAHRGRRWRLSTGS